MKWLGHVSASRLSQRSTICDSTIYTWVTSNESGIYPEQISKGYPKGRRLLWFLWLDEMSTMETLLCIQLNCVAGSDS